MVHSLRIFYSFYLVNLKSIHEYKVNWLAGFVKIPFVLTLQFFLWKAIYSFSGGTLNGYGFDQILIYFVGLSFISISQGQSVAEKIQKDIQRGNLAVYLARPVSYLFVKYAEFCAYWSISAIVAFIFMIASAISLNSNMSLISVPLVAVSLFLSSVIYFLFEVTMGVCSIWLYRILGMKLLVTTLFDVFGGKLFPVDFLPSEIRWLSYLTPWRGIFYEPLRYLQGFEDPSGIFVQLITAFALSIICYGIWSVGRKKYDGGV